MKKRFFYLLLLLAFSPLIYGSASAPELILPIEHWAYDYMTWLSQAGFIPDYPGEYIKEQQKALTRYEIANYLKTLIVKEKGQARHLNKNSEYILNRLIVEFKVELSDLGINITHLEPLSPARSKVERDLMENGEYLDLDALVTLPEKSEGKSGNAFSDQTGESQENAPYYYFGSYDTVGDQHDYFLFIPADFLDVKKAPEEKWEVIYQINKGKRDTYLLVEGGLPLKENNAVNGYYLFPLALADLNPEGDFTEVEESAINLLTSLYETYQISGLQQIEGTLPLNNFSHLHRSVTGYELTSQVTSGMQIGDLIVSTGLGLLRTENGNGLSLPKWRAQNKMGKPVLSLNATYLLDESEEGEEVFAGLNLGLLGSLPLTDSAEIYGGFSWGYDQDPEYLRKMSVVNSLVNAGVSLKLNDYLSLLADFTYFNDLVNQKDGTSFTSLGLEWGERNRLILGLQMLSVETPNDTTKLIGEFSLQF